MKGIKRYILLSALIWSQLGTGQSDNAMGQVSKQPFTIGETISSYSNILEEDRALNIYLPASYSKTSDKKYPVIYLLDGSADEDFIHVAGLVQFGSFSWIQMIPETIVVGIGNVDRKRDFTYPTNNARDKQEFPTTGGSANFIAYLEQELLNHIERNYRTTGERTLIGQSLGGLLATEILLKKSELFDNYIIVSPSLWWDDESLLSYEPKPYTETKKVYIGVGKEGPIMEHVAHKLKFKLEKLRSDKIDLHYGFFEELDHGDTLHLALYDAFQTLFANNN